VCVSPMKVKRSMLGRAQHIFPRLSLTFPSSLTRQEAHPHTHVLCFKVKVSRK
jgi:hypothetical protein